MNLWRLYIHTWSLWHALWSFMPSKVRSQWIMGTNCSSLNREFICVSKRCAALCQQMHWTYAPWGLLASDRAATARRVTSLPMHYFGPTHCGPRPLLCCEWLLILLRLVTASDQAESRSSSSSVRAGISWIGLVFSWSAGGMRRLLGWQCFENGSEMLLHFYMHSGSLCRVPSQLSCVGFEATQLRTKM